MGDRAWTTGDGPKALFDGAVVWLREHRVLLPGVSTLARLVARVRDAAMQWLWDTLAAPLTAAQASGLELLLEIPGHGLGFGTATARPDPGVGSGDVGGAGPGQRAHRDRSQPGRDRGGPAAAGNRAGPLWHGGQQLPHDPDPLLADHARDLDAALRHVAGRLIANTEVGIDEQGRLHAGKIDAVPDPPSLTDLRRRCEAMLPRVDIGEVVLEVMSWQPEFLAAFTPASGGQARLDDLGVSVAAALTAHVLNVGFAPDITPGVAALTRHRISHVDQNYLRAETYAAANAPLSAAQADIALAQAWGGGLVAAVDGVRFVVPVRSIDTRPNPRYFGRRRGVTLLNLVNDQAVGLAGQVVSGTPRDSLHVIDLIYRQDGGRRPEVIISDTGSDAALARATRGIRSATRTSCASPPTCAGTSTCMATTRSNSPTSPGPAARYATPTMPATTKSADRCRSTGAESMIARRAVPDVRAP